MSSTQALTPCLFLKAAEKGVPEAMNNLALSLMQEEGENQNTLRANSQKGASTQTGKTLEDLEESLEESHLMLRALGHESPESPEEEKKRNAQEALLAELKKKIKIEDPFPRQNAQSRFRHPPQRWSRFGSMSQRRYRARFRWCVEVGV